VKEALKSEHGCRSLDLGPKLVVILRARHETWDSIAAVARRFEDLILDVRADARERLGERP
jgi:hypothetical protein